MQCKDLSGDLFDDEPFVGALEQRSESLKQGSSRMDIIAEGDTDMACVAAEAELKEEQKKRFQFNREM
jgi:ABC-type transporter Mla MlaB component